MFGGMKRQVRRGLGVEREHGPVVVQGRQLRCVVCANDTFWAKQVQLHTPLMTFLDLDAWNRVADCANCERCGYIHWFVTPAATEQDAPGAERDARVRSGPGKAP
jgi:predicted nucleic-acid-binding Zn-ribbon protein